MRAWTLVGLWLWLMVALMLVSATGCAVGVAGARVSLATPWSKPNFSYDSVGVAQKNDRASGASFAAEGGGTAAKADADTLTGTADQIVQVGGDASNSRSTDAALAEEQSAAGGAGAGSGTLSGNPTRTTNIAPQANVAPGGLAAGSSNAPAASPGDNSASGTATQPGASAATPSSTTPTTPSSEAGTPAGDASTGK